MRTARRWAFGVGTVVIFLVALAAGQAPAPGGAVPAARRSSPRPDGDLAQLMRGILFPNSNLLFDVQQNDPGAPKKVESGTAGGATQTYANVYTGWQMVEGAAVALEESSDLILKAGRLCSNGKPAPVGRADFIKFAGQLRDSGRRALAAAKEKNQEKVSDITNDIAEACSNCHEIYRDKGPTGSPARCTP
jgi:hypothetical protein